MNSDSQMSVGATSVQQRQWPVIVVSCFLIVAGVAGIVYHLPEWRHEHSHGVWPLVVRLLSIVCGVFMLLRKNWARWLAVVWLAYHVGLSAFHSVWQTVFHLVLLVVFAWVLFRKAMVRFGHSIDSGSEKSN